MNFITATFVVALLIFSTLCDGSTCKIYLLDVLAQLAPKLGYPPCQLDSTRSYPNDAAGHGGAIANPFIRSERDTFSFVSQHAAPYYLAESIRYSKFRTMDILKADVVFIDSFCYYMQMIMDLHYQKDPSNEIFLGRAMAVIMKSKAWNTTNGANFFVFNPHPALNEWSCFRSSQVNMIGVETNQACNSRASFIQVPYYSPCRLASPNTLRKYLLTFIGGCNMNNVGKHMRHEISNNLRTLNASDIFAHCYGCADGCGSLMKYSRVTRILRKSHFCLVMPGDTISSRRLSEVVINGCVPVFLGPPWHVWPMSDFLDYTKFGITVRILKADWNEPNNYSEGQTQPSSHTMNFTDVSGLVSFLRTTLLNNEEMYSLKSELAAHQKHFCYEVSLRDPQNFYNANDYIINRMCSAVKH